MDRRLRITVLGYRDPSDGTVDKVIPRVSRALEANGHSVSVLTVSRDLHRFIDGIRESRPDLVFNVLEQFGDRTIGSDIAAVGLLDLLEVPYTGGGPGEFYLTGDKSLTKKVLAFESIRCPSFAVFSKAAGFESAGQLRMPLFVKPLRLDSSIGIESAKKALVCNANEMMKRVLEIHEQYDDAALVEEYIAGREIYVGLLGNDDPLVLPPIEIDFSGLPPGALRIMDAKAKFERESVEYRGTRPKLADLSEDLEGRIKSIARTAYRALRVRDYGRVDLRIDASGEIYVLEVNASCYLDELGEFAMAADAAGMDYDQLIQRIVATARDRGRSSSQAKLQTPSARPKLRVPSRGRS